MFHARFDDAISGRSRILTDPLVSFVATEPSEVRGVVASAEAAAGEGKWVAGYVAYEAATAFDSSLQTAPSYREPLAWFGVFDGCVVQPIDSEPDSRQGTYVVSPWQRGTTSSEYADAFAAIREAIRLGDTYQVNLTFPLHAAFGGDATALYRDLIRSQRPAYAAYLQHDDTHVVSVSPERFFAVEAGRITTRPMKGLPDAADGQPRTQLSVTTSRRQRRTALRT